MKCSARIRCRKLLGRPWAISLVLTALSLPAIPLPAPADDESRPALALESRQKNVAGTLETRFGRVTWTPPGGSEADAVPRLELDTGARLQTYPQARASVRFRDGTFLRVNELTRLEIVAPPATPASTTSRGRVRIQQGEVLVSTSGLRPAGTILVPHAEGTPRGTEFLVRVDPTDGTAEFLLFDGEMTVTTPTATQIVPAGHAGRVEPDGSIRVRPLLEAKNVIQWWIDYPFVLDLVDLDFTPAEAAVLGPSLAAYRQGDLLAAAHAFPGYPNPPAPTRDGPRLYLAALLLANGAIEPAKNLLEESPTSRHPAARALCTLIHALESPALPSSHRAQAPATPTPEDARTASEWLAASYLEQSGHHLGAALDAARHVTRLDPAFGPAWARVAELEFAQGRRPEALAAIDAAVTHSPALPVAHATRGFVLAAAFRFRDALAAFDRALALDPELAVARLGRGLVQRHTALRWFGWDSDAGELELERAAMLEPRRAAFRAYLAKALLDRGETARGLRDLDYASHLDPEDPTSRLFAALGLERENRVNEAIDHLQTANALGEHRALFRSPLLLDQDDAVRGANLARMYQDAGLDRLALAEASRAVESDYTLGSSHLFLANTYQLRRDPHQVSLRYETPWLSEYLLASLLSPVGAGVLSPNVSSQEFSSLFDRNRVGLVSRTDYESRGDWRQSGTAYGVLDRFSYALDAGYRSDRGQHPNGDFEQTSFTGTFKSQVTAADRVLLQVTDSHADSGDALQRYDPNEVHPRFRGTEAQEPLVLAALDHEWHPGTHTLFVVGRLHDRSTYQDPDTSRRLAHLDDQGALDQFDPDPTRSNRRAPVQSASEFQGFTTELQQLWETERNRVIGGLRVQSLTLDQSTRVGGVTVDDLFGLRRIKVPALDVAQEESYDRLSVYLYDTLELTPRLALTLGGSYDRQRRPWNPFTAPALSGATTEDQLSPKIGLRWDPWTHAQFRAAFTRSLNGLSFDQSFRLEPAQVLGFQQAFRSLLPESVAGSLPGESIQTLAAGFEQRFPASRTFLTLDVEHLESEADRHTLWTTVSEANSTVTVGSMPVTEHLDFRERSARLGLHQLLGDAFAVAAGYRLTDADLQTAGPDPLAGSDLASTLQEIQLRLLINHASGFVGSADAAWRQQANRGYEPRLPGDAFWQFDLHAGWRFHRRHLEILFGLLNLTDQDYRLNPLILEPELPRGRTFTVSFRAAF